MNPQKLQFSKGEAIRFGWNTAKSNITFFLKIILVFLGIIVIFSFIQGALNSPKIPVLSFAALVIGWLSNLIIALVSYKIWLSFAENKKPSNQDLISVIPLLPRFALASILYSIAVLGAILIFIFPTVMFGLTGLFFSSLFRSYLFIFLAAGVILVIALSYLSTYLIMKYQFFGYFIVALGKEVGPIKSLNLSSKITRGVKMNLYVFSLLSGLITLLGALVFGVGLIWAIPTVGIAHAYIFKKLLFQSQSIASTPSS